MNNCQSIHPNKQPREAKNTFWYVRRLNDNDNDNDHIGQISTVTNFFLKDNKLQANSHIYLCET